MLEQGAAGPGLQDSIPSSRPWRGGGWLSHHTPLRSLLTTPRRLFVLSGWGGTGKSQRGWGGAVPPGAGRPGERGLGDPPSPTSAQGRRPQGPSRLGHLATHAGPSLLTHDTLPNQENTKISLLSIFLKSYILADLGIECAKQATHRSAQTWSRELGRDGGVPAPGLGPGRGSWREDP